VPSGRVSLAWAPPTENTDGSALGDLAGYKIYAGRAAETMAPLLSVDNAGLTRYIVENLETGTWYFAVAAVTADGAESELSNVATTAL
jgi:hypothetical protein